MAREPQGIGVVCPRVPRLPTPLVAARGRRVAHFGRLVGDSPFQRFVYNDGPFFYFIFVQLIFLRS